jgi:hypothetical protein
MQEMKMVGRIPAPSHRPLTCEFLLRSAGTRFAPIRIRPAKFFLSSEYNPKR